MCYPSGLVRIAVYFEIRWFLGPTDTTVLHISCEQQWISNHNIYIYLYFDGFAQKNHCCNTPSRSVCDNAGDNNALFANCEWNILKCEQAFSPIFTLAKYILWFDPRFGPPLSMSNLVYVSLSLSLFVCMDESLCYGAIKARACGKYIRRMREFAAVR